MTVLPPLDRIPADILSAADYEQRAADHISPPTLAWLAGGSGTEQTLRANRHAFDDVRIQPRLLNDFSTASTRVELCGTSLEHPILLAPLGHQRLLHSDAESASARAAAATGCGFVSSTLSSLSLEDIADITVAPKWFQLYFQPRRSDTLALLRRAEAAGYQAIVVTLDTPVQPLSRRAQVADFRFPSDLPPTNLSGFAPPEQVTLEPGQSIVLHGMMSEAPRWSDLAWLLEHSRLPIIAKGALHPGDALKMRDLGVTGVVVSNHGGRALDGSASTLAALPRLRAALGADYPLLMDGGIRSGTDIFKALACGADAVLVGRLQGYALAVAGALGVAHMLKLLRDELELCMALAGTPALADITADCVTGEARC
ncbi:FMN-dependent dehydrogenase, includes L-lactate dehydrogenase and type II isopentenyl diphosphate isomerase [Halopseudomonas xinjiangensis]|uniref:FMN-dependent dehydrogenase, includes L-lactate dehydrogenase and type II isopentenyl diphosphate isomerase n=1 Tax=Halopseudomonas xinjiangensis TaxID=487184 RepID=A0A1H1Q0Y7_9GAMM|nr:alpha-hydroxy acid oxidase [Halopseudomonas xinjiangensis]SDS16993.1 FMN-dependent dehydrogenase, includes L-lactate dehydrogenase and type II isopentenyl diphosphate isomerase [Halopseudomonas xinjiangensis]